MPKTPSLNRSPQRTRPQASVHRQTNSYITPLSNHLNKNIAPASQKGPSKRGRYQDESNRPGQTSAKLRYQPPNLRGVHPLPAAGSTPQSASGFEPPRMTELREQYNQTPSPERLPARPAVVRFAAIADYTGPLESKQRHQRQQQHLRSRIPVQGAATNSLSPRKLFGSCGATKSQPLIQSAQRRQEVTTSRGMSRDKEEANSSPVMASEEALTPMYFTMQYKQNRSQTVLGPNDDTPLGGLGLTAVQNHDIHDGYKRKVSSRFERPEAVVETRYARIDQLGILERNDLIQDKDWIDLVAQGAHHGQEATFGSYVGDQAQLSEGAESTTNQQLCRTRGNRNQPCTLGTTSEGSLLEGEYTYPCGVESKYNPQTTMRSTVALPGKQASKSLGYLGNLSIRNFSWGNSTPKDLNRKEAGATTQVPERPEVKRNLITRTGTVLDRVRKFEALGSGIPKDAQQPIITHHPQASSDDLLDGKQPGPTLKKWYTNSRSNLRQYLQGKGTEPSSEDIASPNPRVYAPPQPSTIQRRQSCVGTEQSSIYSSNSSFEAVRRRVSEAKENLKLPTSEGYKELNLEETYKYQNPDGGRFPPWLRDNGLDVTGKSVAKTGGSSMIDARRRKTDTSVLSLPTDTQQSTVESLWIDVRRGAFQPSLWVLLSS